MIRLRNPELEVNASRLAGWNAPELRRRNFRRLHHIQRRGFSVRAPEVHRLTPAERPELAALGGLRDLMARREFCGVCVVRDGDILLERCAADFAPDIHHSIQSITKTLVPLLLGGLVAEGKLDRAAKVGTILDEVGAAYHDVTIQDVLDMNVPSNFAEDYSAPYAPLPPPGAPVGYAREEIAMGWRLPPEGEKEFGVREFAAGLHPAPMPEDGMTQYKSANTDVLGWIIETVSGTPLMPQIDNVAAAAGFEQAFHVSTDCQGVPVLSGGGSLTLRDLARLGLLFARGHGLEGSAMPASMLVSDALSGRGTCYTRSPSKLCYRNHMLSSPGLWIGHPGYAGQFLMVSPQKHAAIAFFSVLETPHGESEGYFDRVIAALTDVLDAI